MVDVGRETYLNMADEASAADFRREDFDPEAMAIADQYAREQGLPRFEFTDGIDNALALIEAGWRHQKELER